MTDRTAIPATRRPRRPQAGAFPNAWTLFRVRGVPIRVDMSWVLIAGLVLWVFISRFTSLLADAGTVAVVAASAAAALLFFASLLAHELGHTITSLDRDIPVRGVTLFLLGGVTESTREATSAKDEFVIVGIGPFISLVLGAGFGLVYTAVQDYAAPAAVAGYLAWTNLMLAVFNLLPGYPLDGGRLLRSVLWAITGNANRSTRWAARVGQGFAALLIGFGVWALVTPAGGFGGIWEILIGFFLYRGAAASHKRARTRERLAGRTARDQMGHIPPALPADAVLARVVKQVQERPSLLWPVGDPVRGGLTLERIDAVPQDDWWTVTAGQVALPVEAVTVGADAPMDTVLDRLAEVDGGMLIVVGDDGRPVGLLTPTLVADLQAHAHG